MTEYRDSDKIKAVNTVNCRKRIIMSKQEYKLWDIHSHLLPGIDDGSPDWKTTLQMMSSARKAGVGTIVATPHYLPWAKNASPSQIVRLCGEAEQRFQREYQKSMTVLPGNELYYHIDLPKALNSGEALTLNGTRFVLVEFDPGVGWNALYTALQQLQAESYRPILAHLERYRCLYEKDRVERLHRIDVKLQMNCRSLRGSFLDRHVRWCRSQLQSGMIDYIASDMHNTATRPALEKDSITWIEKKYPDSFKAVLYRNAEKNLR